ncbi:hypothetical protein ElyMa_005631100 [Elysia marginata]|uniref:Uncharacterized protein n=1 Tax=Elysia marginata TaxID=1093978 RepID=A0AAV4F8Y3_9GAST|nr:hypothetical protein ElyMa_005631100 [Elysia marginata]
MNLHVYRDTRKKREWKVAGFAYDQCIRRYTNILRVGESGAAVVAAGSGNEHETDRQASLHKVKSSTSQTGTTLYSRIVFWRGSGHQLKDEMEVLAYSEADCRQISHKAS